jgi:hypothetical protein
MDNPINAAWQRIEALKAMEAFELQNHIRSGNVTVYEGFKHDGFFEPIDLGYGWKIRASNPKKPGIPRYLFIAPSTIATSKIWREGQLQRALKHGLTRGEAKRWLGSKYPRRHQMLGYLSVVLCSEKMLHAYLHYERVEDRESAKLWKEVWKIDDDLGFYNRKLFVKHLKEVLGKLSSRLSHPDD